MKKFNRIIAASAAIFTLGAALGACQMTTLEPAAPGTENTGDSTSGDVIENAVHGFTINASYPGTNPADPTGTTDPGTKAIFLDDGSTMKWAPGDKLYMVDPQGTNPTIVLTCDLEERYASTARFHTDEVVPTGSYIVLFGQDNLDVNIEQERVELMSAPSDLSDQIRLYGTVDVVKGQNSATIALNQLFAMFTFNFSNIPSGINGFALCMAVTSDGLKSLDKGTIGPDGLTTDYTGTYWTYLGEIKGDSGCRFFAPMDLTGNQIIFYGNGNLDGRRIYEFKKNGLKLEAGKNYVVNLDFANPDDLVIFEKTESNATIIRDAREFLAASLLNSGGSFSLEQDITFTDDDVFLPVNGFIAGNGHTLSGIQCKLKHCSFVGVLGEDGKARDLHVSNSSFEGLDAVGALAGKGSLEGCSCTDVIVNGRNNVGGLAGRAVSYIKDCSLLGESAVYGSGMYCGGMAGQATGNIENCVVKGTVNVGGSRYVGGIAGYSYECVTECGFEADGNCSVSGEYIVGGVVGSGSCLRCYNVGTVSGKRNVGGVSGDKGCTDCYHIGNVVCTDSWSGGISGTEDASPDISGCYSYGTVLSGNGICLHAPAADIMGSNFTSSANTYGDNALEDNAGFGTGKPFLTRFDDLNVNGGYVDIVWPDNQAGCPILQWQYGGFGGDVEIPGYEIVTL